VWGYATLLWSQFPESSMETTARLHWAQNSKQKNITHFLRDMKKISPQLS
jgi:hypothetical protein